MTREALAFLQSHLREMADDLGRYVEYESPSRTPERLSGFATMLAAEAERAGATVEIVEAAEGNRHVRAEWAPHAGAPMLILGHFDTVWPVGTLETMPFITDGAIARGPGTFDMKAGIVQALWAIRALREALSAERHVVVLMTSDEEVGSGTSRAIIEREAGRATVAFVLEPSQNGALKTARKGVANFHLEAGGRAAHAGLDPYAGISAIDELAHAILALRALADRDAGTTVNVGVVAGGTRSNVIAAHATAEIDVRFSSMREAERIADAIFRLQPVTPGATLTMSGGVNRPPMERTDATAALFTRARAIAADLGFTVDEVAVGGGSDGNFCSAMGIPVLDGLGAVGGGAHAIDEHVSIDAMPQRAALLCGLLLGE
jgi:glutamate carboxypeptidase